MINKYSNIPLYSQLKELIIQKINIEEYPKDSKIPSEQELCEIYDISRPTVRQAINELTNNGVLYKLKGKGTFVSKSKTLINIKQYSGFSESILDSEIPGERNIISAIPVTPKSLSKLRDIFNLPSSPSLENEFGEFIYVVKREDDSLSLNKSYIPFSLFPDIIEDVKNKKPSYDILKGKYPLLPAKTQSSLEVIFIDQTDAQYLKIQSGQPVIKIENRILSKNGQIIEYVITKYRADKCKLTFENNK